MRVAISKDFHRLLWYFFPFNKINTLQKDVKFRNLSAAESSMMLLISSTNGETLFGTKRQTPSNVRGVVGFFVIMRIPSQNFCSTLWKSFWKKILRSIGVELRPNSKKIPKELLQHGKRTTRKRKTWNRKFFPSFSFKYTVDSVYIVWL